MTGTPLDLTPFGPLLSALGLIYWALALAIAGLALWLPKSWFVKVPLAAVVIAAFVLPVASHVEQKEAQQDEAKQKLDASMALFNERCKTAGEKINRTVENVEGVLLTSIRPVAKPSDRSDPNWPDAALPDEAQGDWYIREFLSWEHHEDKRNARGFLNEQPSNLPGYRFVDVKEASGVVYRYRLPKSGPNLARELIGSSSARYAVSFTNLNDPSDRQKWIAGTTVLITDTATNEVIAEKTWFSIDPGQGNTAGFRAPWGFAQSCPPLAGSGSSATRFFVDQILKPTKGE